MSLFKNFKNTTKPASMICEQIAETNLYNCKMGYDYESKLFTKGGKFSKTDGFEEKSTVSCKEMHDFFKSLGAVDTMANDTKRWVIINENDKSIDILSFGNASEIHIVKTPGNIKS